MNVRCGLYNPQFPARRFPFRQVSARWLAFENRRNTEALYTYLAYYDVRSERGSGPPGLPKRIPRDAPGNGRNSTTDRTADLIPRATPQWGLLAVRREGDRNPGQRRPPGRTDERCKQADANRDTTMTSNKCKTMPDWDGKTYNGYPHISETSEREVECVVKTHQGTDDDGNTIYENDCGWSGPVKDLERGKAPMGSRPVWLRCPECGRTLATAKGTTAAGYWSRLDR